jgi:hypothetical protein
MGRGSTAIAVAVCLGLLGPAGCGSPEGTRSEGEGAHVDRSGGSVFSRGDVRRGGGRDPCSLVTREELEEIRGGPLFEGESEDNECRYDARMIEGRIGLHFVTITAGWTDARAEMAAWREGAGFMDQMLQSTEGMSTVSGANLTGLGDEAFFVRAGVMDFLLVRRGNAYVKIEAMGPPEELIAIARLAVERL